MCRTDLVKRKDGLCSCSQSDHKLIFLLVASSFLSFIRFSSSVIVLRLWWLLCCWGVSVDNPEEYNPLLEISRVCKCNEVFETVSALQDSTIETLFKNWINSSKPIHWRVILLKQHAMIIFFFNSSNTSSLCLIICTALFRVEQSLAFGLSPNWTLLWAPLV